MRISDHDRLARRDLEGGLPEPVLLAASYARSATLSGDGLREQHATNIKCAVEDGWIIPDDPAFVFGDDAASGLTLDRPGLGALLAPVRSGEAPFDRIYVRDATRFLRSPDPRWRFWFENEMRKLGVRIVYATDSACVRTSPETVVEPEWLTQVDFSLVPTSSEGAL